MKKICLILVLFFCSGWFPCYSLHVDVATMRVGKLYQETTCPSYDNKKDYCNKHGYEFHEYKESLDASRPIPWTKIKIIQKLFEDPRIKWVFWTDADSLIMNSKIKLESLIDQSFDMITASDSNGINTGQFFIRNCAWSRDFLDRIYAKEEFTHHPWWEQMSIMDEFHKNQEDRKHCKILKQRIMNSYPGECQSNSSSKWIKGDFIIHFAGIRGDLLADLMIKYSKLAR